MTPASNVLATVAAVAPLAPDGPMWLDQAEYYATIQLGDVDGDGHDDVVARGPYGIRTWFYNRRGTGGLGALHARRLSGLPGPSVTGGDDGADKAAFAALNNAAVDGR